MNKSQVITLVIALGNLVVMLLFPPYNYVSGVRGDVPSFEGFQFVFGEHPNGMINSSFLYLEVFVVLINAAIGLLLLHERKAEQPKRRFNYQKITLVMVAINLVLVMLFPPFENIHSITKAALPTFQGFYFVFGDTRELTIVTTILYIEVVFILINGALFWLVFKDKHPEADLTPEQALELARRLKDTHSNK